MKKCAYLECGLEFKPSRPAQKYCAPECSKLARKAYLKKYAQENKEKIQENLDPEKRKKTNKKYFRKNRTRLKKRILAFRTNPNK